MRRAVVLVGLLLALGACGGGDGERRNVQFLAFGDPEELKAYREVIDAFTEEEPDIAV